MSSIAFAAGLAVGYLWAISRARKAISQGIVTGPRTSGNIKKYSQPTQDIPAFWR